jgi:hypothetical protein
MTIKARFGGRVFVPLGPVDLPAGRVVEIPIGRDEPTAEGPLTRLAEIAGLIPENPDTPTDLAAQHDHYLYSAPKRP